MTRLEQLRRAGVSVWLDTLSRELLDSGAFARLIADDGVTGATSNPTIVARALTGSDRYDDQLRTAVRAGVHDARELFLEVALDDVARAADLLRPAYRDSHGRDGFVSFECTPDVADDAAVDRHARRHPPSGRGGRMGRARAGAPAHAASATAIVRSTRSSAIAASTLARPSRSRPAGARCATASRRRCDDSRMSSCRSCSARRRRRLVLDIDCSSRHDHDRAVGVLEQRM
jgi:hypothetical protein